MNNVINEYGKIGKSSKSNKIHHHAYHRFYPIFLRHYRDVECKLLEIGLENTFSIDIWREYLPKSFIYGIDIDEKKTKVKNTKLYTGHQADRKFLKSVVGDINDKLDIILDDGSHVPGDQIITFNYLFTRLLKEGGVYIIEDIETSYWRKGKLYGRKVGYMYYNISVVDIFKEVVDRINIEFIPPKQKSCHKYSKFLTKTVLDSIESVFFGQNCIIIMKKSKGKYINNKGHNIYNRPYRFPRKIQNNNSNNNALEIMK